MKDYIQLDKLFPEGITSQDGHIRVDRVYDNTKGKEFDHFLKVNCNLIEDYNLVVLDKPNSLCWDPAVKMHVFEITFRTPSDLWEFVARWQDKKPLISMNGPDAKYWRNDHQPKL